jgi:hypothetical protein
MTKTLRTALGLYVRPTSADSYFHVNASIITIGLTASDRRWIDQGNTVNVAHDAIRNVGDELENGLYLNNLQVRSQGENNASSRRLYGWEVVYRDIYAVDLTTAERMTKTLRTIRARMDKAESTYGRPSTYGAYLARVASAIGADTIVQPVGNGRGTFYSENEHKRQTIADGIYSVDRAIDAWAAAGATATV